MPALSISDLMFKPGLMTGERILITGGGTGLGKVMAEACLILGAEVYICGRRGGVVEATARELTDAHGGKCVGLACDIRVPEAIADIVATIWADGGALTGLVNNAAGNFISRTEDLSPRGFDAIANIVFRGSFLVTLECGKRWLAEGRHASVVSILATWVWHGGPFTVPSAMSKAGVNVMTQSLAVEWGNRGVRFNAIAPGPFPTEGAWSRLKPGSAVDEAPPADPGIPHNRNGEMRELANLAVYLLSPGSAYVNGQTIAIDGGNHLMGRGRHDLAGWGDAEWEEARSAIRSANDQDRAQRTV